MIDLDAVFNESYIRVLNDKTSVGNRFFDDFYDRFLASSPLVAEKFKNVDMAAQKTMLKQSLFYLLNLYTMKKIPDHLTEIARQHDPAHADIAPELYNLWLECLIDTVRESDPQFNDDVELAWRMICSQGIAFMVFVYNKNTKTPHG